jgi:hypothetical protein
MEPVDRSPRPGGMQSPRRAVAIGLIVALLLSACALLPGGRGAPTTKAEAARLALAQDARFAGIAPRDESLIGQASWYEVTAADDGWQVVVRIGWGDCEAGCINEHRWTYAVGRDATVHLTDETGETLPGPTGVQGKATAGPTCPVETNPPDPACAERPVVGAVLVFTNAAGTEVARATSGADGAFSVELAPGSYTITAQPAEGLMGTPSPMEVVVEGGQPMTEVQVSYDTGIR